MTCRHCNTRLSHVFVDLCSAPASNSYISNEFSSEMWLPLKTYVCEVCWLVQTVDTVGREHFFNDDYAYQSSSSKFWLEHARVFVKNIVQRLQLGETSEVLEIASNDGYLLKNFGNYNISCRGCEPSKSVAKICRDKYGIHVDEDFFGRDYASQISYKFDLIIGNNVLAHVPDINDFVEGLELSLKQEGTICIEFPHIMELIKFNQFDTIYHEHYSYLSLSSVETIFNAKGLSIYDAEKLCTHGGSLRIYAAKTTADKKVSDNLNLLRKEEKNFGLNTLASYTSVQRQAFSVKLELLKFLINQKEMGRVTAGFGAAAKGNTLLNYCGISSNFIEYIFDSAELKQGKLMPGSRIPIIRPDKALIDKVDNIIIFPWNLSTEIKELITSLTDKKILIYKCIPKLELI